MKEMMITDNSKYIKNSIQQLSCKGIYWYMTDKRINANRAQMIPMFTLTEYHFFTVAKGTA